MATYSDFDLYGSPRQETRADGSVTSYSFDAYHRLWKIRETSGSSVLRDLEATIDDRDLIEHVDDLRPARDKALHAVDTEQTQTFTYDSLGRLESATGVFGSEMYAFDDAGWPLNLGGTSVTYSACGADKCVTGTGADQWLARYDASGRRIAFDDASSSFDYEYDWRDRLVGVPSHAIELEYDAFGDRVYDSLKSGVSPGNVETRSFFGGLLVERTEGGTTQQIRNIDGPSGLIAVVVDVILPSSPPIASIDNNRYAQLSGDSTRGLPACALNGGTGCIPCGTEYGAETWSVHGDIQGTPQIVTRANGASAAALLFRTLFGLVRTDHSIGTDFVPSGFVGAPNHQAEIGGSSLGARFYDARSALFFTADELVHGGVGGEQGFNPYSYAVNNPIRYMDPLGLSPDDPEVESWTDYPPFEVEITVESWSESYYDDRDLLDWLDDQDAILDDPEPVPIDLSATAPEWVTWIVDVDTEEQRLRDAAEAEELRLAARGADRFGIGVLLPKLTAAAYGINAGLTQPPQDSTQAVVLTTAQVAQGILFGAHRGGAKVFKTLAAKVGTKALYRAVGNLRAKGGIYLLVQSGVVRYVGRTKDFAARRAAHRLDPRFEGLRFKALLHTDSYAAQRGLEEVVIQAFGGPGKLANTIAGISPRSRNAAKYYRAAVRYFERYGGL